MFFPEERPVYPEAAPEGDYCESRLFEGARFYTAVCRLVIGGGCYIGRAREKKDDSAGELVRKRVLDRLVKLSFYRAALGAGMEKPVWGSLTGIRPAKLMSAILDEGVSERAAVSRFCREYEVRSDRARLCLAAAKAARSVKAQLAKEDVGVYVGVPFCPSRCSYCSFVSADVGKSAGLIPDYLAALFREIEAVGAALRETGRRAVCLYIGGGTPTTLSAGQLDALFRALEAAFDFSLLREITVEAGRPDTITPEKLAVLREHGVTRVSVNPQSMDDGVLAAIGRRHTARDVVNAVELVRDAGAFQLNMDLIAGLPADSPEKFAATLETVLAMKPENITIHTLALKKGSAITLGDTARPDAGAVGKMLDEACFALNEAGFAPYYLYRQKYMSGGFENVGWEKGGTGSLYNICMMEELFSVIALGGGASTKLCLPGGRIERIFNPKYPKEYIESIESIVENKEKLKWHIS